MARTTGPLFSLAATGTLGKALTFSSVPGKSITKRKPERAISRSRPERAARAKMQFLQRAWAPDVLTNNLAPDWQPLAAQRAIPPYNAFLSDNLERASGSDAPRLSPTQLFGDDPGTLFGLTAHVSGTSVNFTANIDAAASMWGGWIYLLQNPLEGCKPQFVAGSWDVLIFGDIAPPAYPIQNLPHNSVWYYGWRTFSYDGVLSTQSIPGATIHIR
jgi:hypothetical protein